MSLSFTYGRGRVRFVHMFNYPTDVSRDSCEKWYLEEHVPTARALPGVVGYRTWEAMPPSVMWTFDPFDRFVRLSEIVFEDMESCLNATVRNPELWAIDTQGKPGFRELECMMLDEEPQYNLVKDIPVQQYKYITNPACYTRGKMVDGDIDDVVMDVYMFNYDPKFTLEEGEDWYLGHHVREGRFTKRLGHRHYMTWKPLRIPEEEGSTLRPNRYSRFTELGLPEYAMDPSVLELEPGERPAMMKYTQDPRGQVIGEWRNIIIDPDAAVDLLK